MKPLSKEANAALSALKATDPTGADETRVRRGLERALGVAIPAATLGVATGATSASAASAGASASGGLTAMSVGAKVMGFVMAVGVGTAVTVGVTRSLTSPGAEPPVTVVASRPRAVTPAPAPREEVEVTVEAEPAAKIAPLAMEPEAIQAAPVVPAPVRARPEPVIAQPKIEPAAPAVTAPAPVAEEFSAPPAPPNTQESYELEVDTNFPNCDPGTEMRSAVSARKLLNANRAEEAVWLLGAYQRRCPSGRWSDEAWAVRMAGLCKLGRNPEVIGLLQWFSTEYPARRAAVVTDLRSSCSEEVLKHGEPSAE